MTTIMPVVESPIPQPDVKNAYRPGYLRLWASSILVFFFPKWASRGWLETTTLRAGLVGVVNVLAAGVWAFMTLCAANIFGLVNAGAIRGHVDRGVITALLESGRMLIHRNPYAWQYLAPADKVATIAALILFPLAYLLIPFFVLLPFGARPGLNRPCVRHVLRTVLLGTGAAFIWGPAFTGTLLVLAMGQRQEGFFDVISNLFVVFALVVIWILAVLVGVVRQDYRKPEDLPGPRDPTCEECGYNLIAADSAGRCPECGKPVSESLGPAARTPTPWEEHPAPTNYAAILRQIMQLSRSPRRLFFSMPTLTGQRAAQRWLILSMILVGGVALLIVPAFVWTASLGSAWDWFTLSGAMAMAVVWVGLALMMVGIETAGIATFSRLNGQGIALAAAAKATCYSSTLMLPWVILGGLQLVFAVYWQTNAVELAHWLKITPRTEQIIMAVSLSAAHIGGLLWYELTVYRGIRAIQFANK